MAPLHWLITGCSSGFGAELASQVLARGDRVMAASRTVDKLRNLKEKGAITLALDPTGSDEHVKACVETGIREAGGIDVLVNNAGYMLEGANEALT